MYMYQLPTDGTNQEVLETDHKSKLTCSVVNNNATKDWNLNCNHGNLKMPWWWFQTLPSHPWSIFWCRREMWLVPVTTKKKIISAVIRPTNEYFRFYFGVCVLKDVLTSFREVFLSHFPHQNIYVVLVSSIWHLADISYSISGYRLL